MVRAEGIEPSRPCGLRIFVPLPLSPPRQGRVRGLDYTFTIPHARFRCCPSSLYTFPEALPGLARDCHFRFPRLRAVLHRRFPDGHSSLLKSAASAISPRPRGQLSTAQSYKQATMIYASRAKRLTAARPGPFPNISFFGRGLLSTSVGRTTLSLSEDVELVQVQLCSFAKHFPVFQLAVAKFASKLQVPVFFAVLCL